MLENVEFTMEKPNRSSSQSEPREEIVHETEGIWGEIFHNENGKPVVRNIPRNESPGEARKEETI